METQRLFLAIPLPGSLKRRLGEIQEAMQSRRWEVAWAPPENLHLTLHFLGATPANLLEDLRHDLGACAHAHRPFDLPAGGVGAFPSLQNPRVLWAGIDDKQGKLSELHAATMKVLNQYRLFKLEEREFRPHLTLGRVKELKGWDPAILENLLPSWASLGHLPVEEMILVRSQLGPQSAHHETLQAYSLLQN